MSANDRSSLKAEQTKRLYGRLRQFHRHPIHIMWWERGLRRVIVGPLDLFYQRGHPSYPDAHGLTISFGTHARLEFGNRDFWFAHS